MKMHLIPAVVLLTFALAQSLSAQPPVPEPGGPPMPPPPQVAGPPPGSHPPGPDGPMQPPEKWENRDLRELVEMVRVLQLSRDLGLSDEETVKLMRRREELKKKTSEINQEREKVSNELKKLVHRDAPDAQIEENLNRLIALDRELLDTRIKSMEKAGEGLTVKQRAKLFLFAQDFEKNMRQLIEKARERRGQGEGQGPWQERMMQRREELQGGGPAGGVRGRPMGPMGPNRRAPMPPGSSPGNMPPPPPGQDRPPPPPGGPPQS